MEPVWADLSCGNKAATIRVDANGLQAYSDPDVGDYHRLLLPGTYAIEVSAPGFVYTAAMQAADGAGATLEARVAQLSTSFGYGPERVLITDE